jgi:RNA polymerase sigma-70 factor (ECF subfamily)
LQEANALQEANNEWSRVTHLLNLAGSGDAEARSELYEKVYRDLRRIAGNLFAGERPGHTLQPTALLNEAFIKLTIGATVDYQDRVHFFAVAARQMRRILVDHARWHKAEKRDAQGVATITLVSGFERPLDLLDVDRALEELAELDPRCAQVVDLRFFGGLTEEEAAEALSVSPATVRADWKFAKGWLIDRLEGSPAPR